MNFLVNAVKLYFNRNWTRQDMMSSAPIPQHARTSFQKVFVTLLCATLAAALGSHLFREEEGQFTVIYSLASFLWLHFTSPWGVWRRLLFLIVGAFCIGASAGHITEYFFEINQSAVVRFLQGVAIVFGCFLFAAMVHREKRQIYFNGLIQTYILMQLSGFDIHQWTLKAYVLLAFFMGYLVLYSQEILYDARFGEIDFVNGTYAIFLHLPAIVVHAKKRVLLLMIAAFSFGASIGIFTNYLFEIDLDIVVSILSSAAIGFGTFWFGALLSRLRAILYIGCLLHSHAFMLSWLVITSDMIFGGYTVQWTLKVFAVLAMFMGYFVIYSQEIVYNSLSEDVNFVNCTFTVFFNLPAIVVHVARLELIEVTKHFRQS
uniref:Bax inhibitor n=1 Tax=Solanum tuberosum TaxID=4113 RepID=M1AVG1_SOLTU